MIEIKVDDREVLIALQRLSQAVDDMTPAMRAIAGVMADATERAFANQADPATGAQWADLSDTTKKRRAQHGYWPGSILQVIGNLARNMEQDYGRDYAAFGTNTEYAGTHQFGAKMGEFGRYSQIARYRSFTDFRRLAGTKKGFPIPWNDIPARPFLGLGESDKEESLNIISQHINRSMRR